MNERGVPMGAGDGPADAASAARPASRSSYWPFVLTLLLAAVLLVLAFRGVDWQVLLATLKRGELPFILLAFVLLSGSFFLRGLRWRVLLSARERLAPVTMLWATSVGYLGNSFLPARAGEVLRSVMIGRHSSISKSYAFATALTERLLDVPTLVLMSLVALLSLEGMPAWLETTLQVMTVLALVGVGGLLLAPRLEGVLLRFVRWLPLPEGLQDKLVTILEQFLLGMRAVQHPGRLVHFVVLTVLIWMGDIVFAILLAQALHLTMGPAQAMLLLAALGLSSAAPSTPGYVGIYQFVAVTVLPPFGFAQSEALAYILTYQAVTYLVVMLWGFLGLWRLGLVREVSGGHLPTLDEEPPAEEAVR